MITSTTAVIIVFITNMLFVLAFTLVLVVINYDHKKRLAQMKDKYHTDLKAIREDRKNIEIESTESQQHNLTFDELADKGEKKRKENS